MSVHAKNEVCTCAYIFIFVPTNIYTHTSIYKHAEVTAIIAQHLLYLEDYVIRPPPPEYHFRTRFTFCDICFPYTRPLMLILARFHLYRNVEEEIIFCNIL